MFNSIGNKSHNMNSTCNHSDYNSTEYHETKLCIIIDSRTPIIATVPIPPTKITLGHFKSFANLNNNNFKFYFKSQDSEFGIVKEEVADDDSFLPVDGDRVVAWVISQQAHQSLVFEQETSQDQTGDIHAQKESPYIRSTSSDVPPPLPPFGSRGTVRGIPFEDFLYIRVQLQLDNYNFLGLTLVGPSDEASSLDRGIYVSEIAKNSVVEQNGQIQIGDRILEINETDLTKLSNDAAVTLFRSYVERRGAINLVLQRDLKSQRNSKKRFTLPREYANVINHDSPDQPNSPRYLYEDLPIPEFGSNNSSNMKKDSPKTSTKIIYPGIRSTHSLPRSITPRSLYAMSNFDSIPLGEIHWLPSDSRSVYERSTPTSLRQIDIALHCVRDSIQTIYAALCNDAKSLDIKDREWLRVVVKNAFLGSSLVKWLSRNVYGFNNKREVKCYANRMLTQGLIRNPITSGTFSEKCYYTIN